MSSNNDSQNTKVDFDSDTEGEPDSGYYEGSTISSEDASELLNPEGTTTTTSTTTTTTTTTTTDEEDDEGIGGGLGPSTIKHEIKSEKMKTEMQTEMKKTEEEEEEEEEENVERFGGGGGGRSTKPLKEEQMKHSGGGGGGCHGDSLFQSVRRGRFDRTVTTTTTTSATRVKTKVEAKAETPGKTQEAEAEMEMEFEDVPQARPFHDKPSGTRTPTPTTTRTRTATKPVRKTATATATAAATTATPRLKTSERFHASQPKVEKKTEIDIFVRDLNGKTHTVRIAPDAFIADVKDRIARFTKIHRGEYYLENSGKTLEDERTLVSYTIRNQANLNMRARLRGGRL